MKKNNNEDMSVAGLIASLIMAPFEILTILVKMIFVLFIIAILLTGYGMYDNYKSPKCNECNRQVEIGEYCKHCGILMTDSTTYRNKMVYSWQIVD